jgi:rhodanese-related sulfurtransferase
MKRFLLAVLFCVAAWTPVRAADVKNISSVDARTMTGKLKNIYLLDVRTVQEREQGYIPGSILIPIDAIGSRIAEIPKNRPIIVYCAVGVRSKVVAQALAKKGYPEVYNMRDGINGWYRNGYPVQR